MAAPSAATRLSPGGTKLGDGFRTLVTLSSDTNIELWEKSVTPPGIQGDDPTDTTTMQNTTWRTKSPRGLATLTDMTFTAQYDPVIYQSIIAILLDNITITIQFPDHSTLAFYGFVQSFIPGELVEGTPPEATITIVPTNQDPTTCDEEGPVYTAGAGTGAC